PTTRATPFPYTTLFRSKQQTKRRAKAGAEQPHAHRIIEDAAIVVRVAGINVAAKLCEAELPLSAKAPLHDDAPERPHDKGEHERSEEHTSELQSPAHLV